MSGSKVKEKTGTRKTDTYAGLQDSTQTFGAIGLLEATAGDVVLRGREGERDHLYPLPRAIRRYYQTLHMINALVKHGVRGWDTLMDINNELQQKILEAIKQRRSLNRGIPAEALAFEQRFSK